MRVLLFFLLSYALFSCSNDFREITAISEINGAWGNDKESFIIDTERMTISYPDSVLITLSSRVYDRSKITASIGSVMLYDAHVFINSDGSSIKITKINKKESSIYLKK